MKVFVLLSLTMLLAALLYLDFKLTSVNQVSDVVQKDYLEHEYIITKKDETGYYGKSTDGLRIYFKKEKVTPGHELKVDDHIIVYFEEDRKDGLVKVEGLKVSK